MDESVYRPGSKEDFHRLYQVAYQRVFHTLAAILADESAAEDCTQETFLSAFKAWKSWKADAPAEAWIHRIAVNTAISYRRKQRLREVGELIRRLGHPSLPDPTVHDLRTDLLREIAAALGAPESTIASRLMEAKRTLRIRLGDRPQEIFDTSEGHRVPYSK